MVFESRSQEEITEEQNFIMNIGCVLAVPRTRPGHAI